MLSNEIHAQYKGWDWEKSVSQMLKINVRGSLTDVPYEINSISTSLIGLIPLYRP